MSDDRFDFEELKVYQKSLDYVGFVYEITEKFPKKEMFSLANQYRRASVSICLNIAEGSGGSKAEFNQFLKISRRSVRECVAVIEIAYRQSFVSSEVKKQS
ncbi:MAG: four helix bundle protein [Candidatus Scalindua sp.]|nr:four helix bundle protein [Candidatus Scalindua sp.]